jgi:toxin FitB
MYLLDTNIVSELRKNRPHGGVLAWLDSVDRDDIFLSVITLAEVQAGIEVTRRQNPLKAAEIEAWLDQLPDLYKVLVMDVRTSREWARLMDGQPPHLSEDAMLAATARVHRLTVVTRNTRDFERFDVPVLNPFKVK